MAQILPQLNVTPEADSRVVHRVPTHWLSGAAVLLLLSVMFAPLFVPIEWAWRKDPNYSHGYLIPLICLGLFIRARRRAGPSLAGNPRLGFLILLPASFLLLAATLVPWPLITCAALSLLLGAGLVAIGGRAWASFFIAPILFAFFMFPVPFTWTSYAALWLQEIVSRLSAGVLDQFVLCLRTGTMIQIVGVPQALQVAQECSGLRQIIGFVAFAALLGLLVERPAWQRLLLIALAVPVAVIANVVRVLLMSAGAIHFGTSWMNGSLHDAPAAFTIPVGFGMLIGFDWFLNRGKDGRQAGTSAAKPAVPSFGAATPFADRLRPVFVFLILLIAVQGLLRWHLSAVGHDSFPSIRAPLAELPTDFASGWHSHENQSDLAEVRRRLDYKPDDILLREYSLDGTNLRVQVYAVYSSIGEDRKHHPEVCIRDVAGAPEQLSARQRIALDPEGKRQVQRFVFLTGPVGRITVYYWHYTLKAPVTGKTFLQILHQGLEEHPPSLTVQVTANRDDPAALQLIESKLAPLIDQALMDRFLPPSAIIEYIRLPVTVQRE